MTTFPNEHTDYEVWEQRGGFNPTRALSGLTKDQAEAMASELRGGAADHARPESMPFHYLVVAAHTTRREVH